MEMKNLLPLMDAIRAMSGVQLVFKPGDLKYDRTVPEEYYNHCNAFCTAVKRGGTSRKCTHDDVDAVVLKAEKTRTAFMKRCHAGVLELVVPVFSARGYEGAFYFGPMRPENGTVQKRLSARFRELPLPDTRIQHAAKTLLSLLAAYIVRENETLALTAKAATVVNPKIRIMLDYIETHIAGTVRVRDAAREASLSASRCIHLFKEETGVTFSDYVLGRKIDRAKRLLANTTLSVTDIAFEAGYTNQSYFSSAFKRASGLTPRAYRDANRRVIKA
ncbi:MAG: helix-turn-helix domain-containing protein [Spirochaetes bacterium]|nr:helix-turn-helix domain-containing protein [Spirochaetota bacterium]